MLTFDASVLEVERVVGPEGWGASFATSAPGEATLIAWSPSAQPLPGGAAAIWDVQVRVLGGVGNYSDLCLSDVTVSDEDGEPLAVIPGP
ncbi:MAG: hypothetical protein GTO22_21725, partial [Gemmatimonadales bacterium]|nr:hypothetical protein [Gemmatimonadales bacterium]